MPDPTEPLLTGAEIAIVGMALRVPGAASPEAFWRNLIEGVCSVSRFSREEALEAGAPAEWLDDPAHVRAGGRLDGLADFDAAFFGVSPREAELMDPQQRHFLELAWEALERAGYDPARVKGAVGLFAGAGLPGYLLGHLAPDAALVGRIGHFPLMIANDKDFLATRAAYKLDLRGPAMTVQTACSTSLVAVHMACQSLLNGECDMALAGGIALNVRQAAGYLYQEGGIGSPDGVCRAFDAAAAGTVGGSGGALVTLKRLEDAVRDGDTIHAVIKGSAITNDGAGKVGYTAPSVEGQARAIAEALAIAGVSAEDIGYVEAHGTGTALGDPIEVAALTEAFRAHTDAVGTCYLGSVKTNLGHLDVAAGVVGLIKAALAVEHGEIPSSLHVERPHPGIDFASSPFVVADRRRPWPGPRLAGVSSFGIGGTNAHVVLEAYSPAAAPAEVPGPVTLHLSARSEAALAAASARLADHLATHRPPLGDVAFTLARGRRAFAWRRAVVASTHDEAIAQLALPEAHEAVRPGVCFLFPGQGAQAPGMARGLYDSDAAFRALLDAACDRLAERLGTDLRPWLFPAPGAEAAAAALLARTEYTQCALFVVSWALGRWLIDRGVTPQAMIGHSVGEYVAACLAGVFTLEDAIKLVVERGRLLQAQPGGKMLAVALSPEAIAPWLRDGVALAAVNAPERCVVAGEAGAIDALAARLAESGVAARGLDTSHAFHSPLVAPAAEALTAAVAAVPRQAPALAYVSNLTGRFVSAAEAVDPAAWGRHVAEPVRFADSLATVAAQGRWVFLEVGPDGGLARLAASQVPGARAAAVLGSDGLADARRVREALGLLWATGATAEAEAVPGRRVPLPTYPFEHRRYWIPPYKAPSSPAGPARAASVSDALHAPVWRPLPRLRVEAEVSGDWLVVGEATDGLASALRARGATVSVASPGAAFGWTEDHATLRLDAPDDHRALWEALSAHGRAPGRLVFVAGGMGPEAGYSALSATLVGAATHAPGPVAVTVVAPGLWNVTGAEAPVGALATLLGPARVAPVEEPGLSVRVLDPLDAPVDGWLAELSSDGPGEVALRNGRRWAPGWTPMPVERPTHPPTRPDGVYLLTGGYGTLALAIAEHLAAPGVSLALVGRRAPAPGTEAAARLEALEARGAAIARFEADVADAEALAGVVTAVTARFGALHGVYHLAGIAGGGLLRFRRPDEALAVLRPKVAGLEALVAALDGRTLDFCLLASSVNASVPTPGQADYAAANAYMEAIAEAAPAALGMVAVAFGPWRDAGMAARAELPEALRAQRDEAVAHGLTTAEGLEAIARALTAGQPRVMASPVAPDALGRQAAAWRTRLVASPPPAPRPVSAGHEPPQGPLEEAIAAVWRELLGVEAVGRHDHFFALGGHSLTAVALLARLEALAGRKLPVERLLQGGTVASLAEVIAGAAPEPAPAVPGLVPLASGGEGAPVFLVHPSGGSVLCYAELAGALGGVRPVWGLEAPGLSGEAPLAEMDAIAARYVETIRRVRPTGPYHLAGWSLGGVIAFEMARRLRAEGEPVPPVVVIDNVAPVGAHKPAALPDAQLLAMFAEDLRAVTGVALAPAPGDDPRRAFDEALASAEAAGRLASLGGADELRRRFEVFRAHLHAAIAYAPTPGDEVVLLLRAGARPEPDATLGWGQLASVSVIDVPGDHYSIMAGEGARALADALRTAIADAERSAV